MGIVFSRVMKWLRSIFAILIHLFLLPMFGHAASSKDQMLVYIGSYTGAKSKGIYLSRFDPTTGKLTTPELAAEMKNPTFLALHPNNRFLYAVGETSDGPNRSGAVSAFQIDKATGKLSLLNQQSSGGG